MREAARKDGRGGDREKARQELFLDVGGGAGVEWSPAVAVVSSP